jgi:hypothetical protein
MEYLKPEYWNIFMDSEGKFIGKKFEELVHDILRLGFGGDWQQTPLSWDGGKDFINNSYNGNSKGWAECKMYRKNLTTHNFAKTLVMAVNNSIDSIIIFSYSPLVKNAQIHLGDFATMTNKSIQVFDDSKLEQLMFKHLSGREFKKYFPGFVYLHQNTFTYSSYLSYSFLSNDITIEWSQLNEEQTQERNIVTKRNTPCLYELCFISNLTTREDLKIDFSSFFTNTGQLDYRFNFVNLPTLLLENQNKIELDSARDEIENTNYIRTVIPGQIFSLKLYFIPIEVGELVIPPINFHFGDIKEQFAQKKLTVSNLASPPLIGAEIHETIHNTDLAISSNNRVVFQIVCGGSGVGKTRYAKEIIDRLLKYNFRVNILDGSTSNCDNFAKFVVELLTQLYKLPNPYKFENKDITINLLEEEGAYTEKDEIVYSIIKQCIHNNEIDKEDLKKKLIPVLFKLILERRSALIIDNVQALDDDIIDLLYRLLELNNTVGQNFIMYIFNTDTLDLNSKSWAFYNQLQNSSLLNKSFVSITPFKPTDVRLFIDSTIRIKDNKQFSTEHQGLFRQIVKDIPARPFYLSQFIDLLFQDEIISLDKGEFYINDISSLDRQLKTLSNKETDILTARLSRLTDTQLNVLSLIIYLGEIDFVLLKSLLPNDIDAIEYLTDANFLIKEYDKVKIIHSLMDNFLVQKAEEYCKFLKAVIKESILSNAFLRKQYPHALFSISSESHLFDSAILKVLRLSEISTRNQFYAKKILDYIYFSPKGLKPEQYLFAINKILSLVCHDNRKIFLSKLLEMWEFLEDYIPTSNIQAVHYIEIARECGSFLTVYGQYDASIKILNEAISKVKSHVTDSRTRNKLIARLTNRIGVNFKQALDYNKSKKFLLFALELSTKSESVVEEYLTYIDLGYIFYGRNKEKTIEYWKNVHDLSVENEEKILNEDPDTGLACILIKSLFNGISGNYQNAIIIANKLINMAQNECSIYYELQGRRAKALFEFKLDYPVVVLEEQLMQIISISSGAKIFKYHLFAYHLLAVIYEQQGKIEKTTRHYQYILQQIKNKEVFKPSLEACLLISDSKKHYSKYELVFPLKEYEVSQICLNKSNQLEINSPFSEDEYCLTLA